MSAQTKTRAQKASKFLGIVLFAFLMFLNIKFAIGGNTNGDIDLFGLKISTHMTESYARNVDRCPGSVMVCETTVYTDGDLIIIVVDRMGYNV